MQVMIAAVWMHLLNRSFHLQIVSSSYDIVTTVFLQHEYKESATATRINLAWSNEIEPERLKSVACLQGFSNFRIFHLFMGSNGPGGPVAKGKQGRQKLPSNYHSTRQTITRYESHRFVLDQAPQLLTHPTQTLSSQLHSKLNQTKTDRNRPLLWVNILYRGNVGLDSAERERKCWLEFDSACLYYASYCLWG